MLITLKKSFTIFTKHPPAIYYKSGHEIRSFCQDILSFHRKMNGFQMFLGFGKSETQRNP